jgi:dihydrofolate synthase/folylpolyglutamate synthase
MPEVSYEEALSRLAAASHRGMRLGLATTESLLAELGNPERSLRGVLVAGTNGKGSVCAMVAEIGARAGLKVALLTKPHLTSYRERISLGGAPVSELRFEELIDQVLRAESRMDRSAGLPTHHELLTAMGFVAAAEYGADLTVCEVGLGGRLDATNVWDGGVAVVVTVGLDHQAQLGNTVAEIAAEKAAIIKPKDLAVTGAAGETLPVIRAAASRAGSRLWELGQQVRWSPVGSVGGQITVSTPSRDHEALTVGLGGGVQLANAAVSVAVADCLQEQGFPIREDHVRQGLAEASWPGRLQSVGKDPLVIVDSAHNPHAVEAVLPDLRQRIRGRRAVLVFGSMGDHDHRGMLELLATLPFELAFFARANSARAVAPEILAGEWPKAALVVAPVGDALDRSRMEAGPAGAVVVVGSIYVVGEALAHLGIGLPPDPVVSSQPLW